MRQRSLFVCVLFAVATIATVCVAGETAPVLAAGPPKAVIVGPETLAPGQLLRLRAAGSAGDDLIWRSDPAVEFLDTVDRRSGEPELAYPNAAAGRYRFELIVAGVVDGKAAIAAKTHTVQVGPPSPTPVPPGPAPAPLPVPPPAPDLPDGSLAADACRWAAAVDSPERAAQARAMAGAFEAAAAEVAAGTAKTPTEILAAMARHCRAALPAEARAPWTVFEAALGAKINALYRGGDLNGPDAWADAFRAIARGLSAVA